MIAGIDVGGTKTHLRVERDGAVVRDLTVPTSAWLRGGLAEEESNADRLLELVADVEGAGSAALVVGAHGLDNDAQTARFQAFLTQRHPGPVRAVNDVELLGPAVGLDHAIAVVVGTGSKVVGHATDGAVVAACGYGFLLDDPGSAAALARDAVRAVIDAADAGEPLDVLGEILTARFGVSDEVALAYAFTDDATLTAWGALAPLVFDAADRGSLLAARVVDDAAFQLARAVARVHRRGALGADVVCAGGVVVNQPRLYQALVRCIGDLDLGLRVQLVDVPPVLGALALAEQLSAHASTNGSRSNR